MLEVAAERKKGCEIGELRRNIEIRAISFVFTFCRVDNSPKRGHFFVGDGANHSLLYLTRHEVKKATPQFLPNVG